jgi:hypothetical protein
MRKELAKLDFRCFFGKQRKEFFFWDGLEGAAATKIEG